MSRLLVTAVLATLLAAAPPITASAAAADPPSGTTPGTTLGQALDQLAAAQGFVADVGPEARDLPVPADAGQLEALLRGTNHVVVRDAGKVVRVLVFGPGSPDHPGTSAGIVHAANIPGPAEDDAAPDIAGPDVFAVERDLVARGLAPDTERPTGLADSLARALAVQARERGHLSRLPLQ